MSSATTWGVLCYCVVCLTAIPSPMSSPSPDVVQDVFSLQENLHVRRAEDVWLHVYVRSRDATNPAILFIVGGQGTPGVIFEDRFAQIAEHFTFVTYSLRGIMGINNTQPAVSTEDHMSDAAWMLDYTHRRFGRVVLFGMSLGADMALQVARAYPHLVHGVVAMSGFYDIERAYALAAQEVRRRAPRWLTRYVLDTLGRANVLGYLVHLYVYGIYGLISYDCARSYPCLPSTMITPREPIRSPFLTWWHVLALPFQMNSCIRSFLNVEEVLRTPPAELSVPVAFVVGAYDKFADFEITTEYMNRLQAPRKRMVVLDKSTHFPPLEQTEEFNQAIVTLVTEMVR